MSELLSVEEASNLIVARLNPNDIAARHLAKMFDPIIKRAVDSAVNPILEYAKQRERELTRDVDYWSHETLNPGRAQASRYRRSAWRELIAQFEIKSAYWMSD